MRDETRVTRLTERGLCAAAHAEACLVEIHGPRLGKRYVLPQGALTLGREEGCDLVVELDNVSRLHARLVQRDGCVTLEDLRSTNGTFLDGRRVGAPTKVPLDTPVKVGTTTFELRRS